MTDPDLVAAIKSAGNCMASWPGDWGADHRTAWLYGIVLGWDVAAMNELAQKFRWSPEEVTRLRSYLRAVAKITRTRRSR